MTLQTEHKARTPGALRWSPQTPDGRVPTARERILPRSGHLESVHIDPTGISDVQLLDMLFVAEGFDMFRPTLPAQSRVAYERERIMRMNGQQHDMSRSYLYYWVADDNENLRTPVAFVIGGNTNRGRGERVVTRAAIVELSPVLQDHDMMLDIAGAFQGVNANRLEDAARATGSPLERRNPLDRLLHDEEYRPFQDVLLAMRVNGAIGGSFDSRESHVPPRPHVPIEIPPEPPLPLFFQRMNAFWDRQDERFSAMEEATQVRRGRDEIPVLSDDDYDPVVEKLWERAGEARAMLDLAARYGAGERPSITEWVKAGITEEMAAKMDTFLVADIAAFMLPEGQRRNSLSHRVDAAVDTLLSRFTIDDPETSRDELTSGFAQLFSLMLAAEVYDTLRQEGFRESLDLSGQQNVDKRLTAFVWKTRWEMFRAGRLGYAEAPEQAANLVDAALEGRFITRPLEPKPIKEEKKKKEKKKKEKKGPLEIDRRTAIVLGLLAAWKAKDLLSGVLEAFTTGSDNMGLNDIEAFGKGRNGHEFGVLGASATVVGVLPPERWQIINDTDLDGVPHYGIVKSRSDQGQKFIPIRLHAVSNDGGTKTDITVYIPAVDPGESTTVIFGNTPYTITSEQVRSVIGGSAPYHSLAEAASHGAATDASRHAAMTDFRQVNPGEAVIAIGPGLVLPEVKDDGSGNYRKSGGYVILAFGAMSNQYTKATEGYNDIPSTSQ